MRLASLAHPFADITFGENRSSSLLIHQREGLRSNCVWPSLLQCLATNKFRLSAIPVGPQKLAAGR